MNKNRLGNSDLYVSEIGFGCMSLGMDQPSNEKLIHYAIDQGINFFDTADLYQRGWNEESVGKALHGKRNNVILASKGGNEWKSNGEGWQWNPSKQHIKTALKESLRRLNTDYLDLYQLHGGTIDDPIGETIEAFEELVQEGTVRYYGISSIRPNVIKSYLKESNIVSIMMQYSLLDRRPEEFMPYIEEHNVSIIARGPVAKGHLTERYKRKLTSDGYLTYSEQELKEMISNLLEKANDKGLTLEQLALRYVIDHSAVVTTIPGASSIEQLERNISAAFVDTLSEEELVALGAVTNQIKYDKHR
ncbi:MULTISPECIES: aldo/keto reductase [Bacillaceae]|uniref:Aldo/keto reductase n=1 Tax=Evansella alkalicola TaxID=745819 RepID=A0ABS6JZN2_9BACI|nr:MULTISPECIES: aldo/keto reductase [Bacillaceae]MBU9724044.1 aldo/keto reductase [Bacillus alkalicola]